MKTGVFTIVILGLIICFAFTAGCAKLPEEDTPITIASSDPGSSSAEINSASGGDSSSGTIVQVNITTPIPTEVIEYPEYLIPPEQEEPVTNYSIIYSKTDTLRYGVIPFDFKLNYPPMVFTYTLDIPTTTDVKAGYSPYGEKDKYSVSRTIPNPNAWYSISIYDNDTSELIKEEKLTAFADKKVSGTFKIFQGGDYHVEISGNLVKAHTVIEAPPENL